MIAALSVVLGVSVVVAVSLPEPTQHRAWTPNSWSGTEAAKEARIAEQEARKEAIKPTSADTRPKKTGPAYALAGNHPRGEGWVIQVIANSPDTIDVRLWHEGDWDTRHPPALTSPMTVGHSFYEYPKRPVGQPKTVSIASPTLRGAAAEWNEESQHILVMVGTAADDQFLRPSDANRVLYLGLGGSDAVVCAMDEGSYSDLIHANGRRYSMPRPKAFPHDRMVDGDGRPVEVDVSRSCGSDGDSAPNSTNTQDTLDRRRDE